MTAAATREAYAALLARASTATGRAGWRDRLAHAVRFEAALDCVRPGDAVLDLGCGPGALAGYLALRVPEVRYVGVDAAALAIAEARAANYPAVSFVHADLFTAELASADVVVAVGSLVDGTAMSTDAERFERVRRLAERALTLARRAAVLVMLKQEAIEGRASLAADPALGGARLGDAARLAGLLSCEVVVRDDVLATNRALLLRRDGADARFSAASLAERALAGPWGDDAAPLDRASLWLRVGDRGRAEAALGDAGALAESDARGRWLRDAISLL